MLQLSEKQSGPVGPMYLVRILLFAVDQNPNLKWLDLLDFVTEQPKVGDRIWPQV